jgi:3-dehydroquinate dehydratase II
VTAPDPLVLLLSGPNLNLLGEREPHIYGLATLEDHVNTARESAAAHRLRLEHRQSNHEGDLVDSVHAARGRAAAIVINAGAFTHYAWALHDALAAFDGPVVELHLSNPSSREPWRAASVIAPVATGVIAGFGGLGYRLAIEAVAGLLRPNGS